MSKELNNLTAFMAQLGKSGMSHEDIVARGYDYALALYRADCELRLALGTNISSTLHVQLMDRAADLLKVAVEQMTVQDEQKDKQAEEASPFIGRHT